MESKELAEAACAGSKDPDCVKKLLLISMLNDLNNLNDLQRLRIQGELEDKDTRLIEYMESESCYFSQQAEHRERLKELCMPLVRYLREYGCPGDAVIITSSRVKHISSIFEIDIGDME